MRVSAGIDKPEQSSTINKSFQIVPAESDSLHYFKGVLQERFAGDFGQRVPESAMMPDVKVCQ